MNHYDKQDTYMNLINDLLTLHGQHHRTKPGERHVT